MVSWESFELNEWQRPESPQERRRRRRLCCLADLITLAAVALIFMGWAFGGDFDFVRWFAN